MIRVFAVSLALLATPLAAQEAKAPTPYDRAIAAGYKALTLCSGIFTAGRTEAQVEAVELRGIYPEYQAIVPTLKATVERTRTGLTALVIVPFADDMPSRAAAYHYRSGCSLAPIGAKPELISIENLRVPVDLSSRFRPDPRPWPNGDGGIAPTPSPALHATVEMAFGTQAEGPSGSVAVVVARNGHIVAERYVDGFGPFTANRTWSVAKSLAGTVVGAAVQQRVLRTVDPANIPEWPDGDPRRTLTTDQLLRMSSGLHSATAGNRTDAVYFGGTAVTEETVGWPLEVKPGTRFRYANNDILLAIRSLRATLGEDRYASFPHDALFAPLGMRHTVAERDWRGNYILSSQVWSTARDLARFGQLYLQDGVWQGKRILPEGWVKYVTTPSGPQPTGEFGYGATFWLMSRSPGVPADTFAAFGNRGQYVVIVPSRRVVIVRRGEDPAGASFDIARFTAEVLAALK